MESIENIKYNPKLSIKQNAKLNGLSGESGEERIRYYIRANGIDRRHAKKVVIVNAIRKYLKKHPDEIIVKKKCEKYVRAQGVRFDTNVFAKLYHNMIECGYLEIVYKAKGGRKGCRVVDVDKLKYALKDDTVMAYSSRCQKLSVTIQFLHRICRWHKDIKPKYKKY